MIMTEGTVNGGSEDSDGENQPDETLPPININFGEATEPELDIIAETLLGEHMDSFVRFAEKMNKPWGKLSEKDQIFYLGLLKASSSKFILKAMQLMASRGNPTLGAMITNVSGAKALSAKMVFNDNDPLAGELFTHRNHYVAVVLINPEDFLKDGNLPTPDADQKNLDV